MGVKGLTNISLIFYYSCPLYTCSCNANLRRNYSLITPVGHTVEVINYSHNNSDSESNVNDSNNTI